MDPAKRAAILAAADRDFVEGIRWSLGCAIALLGAVLAAGFLGFPRGRGGITDASREATRLEKEESGGSPEGALS
jgi:hypothetical protein